MSIYRQLADLAFRYVESRISVDDFRVAWAGLYFRARQSTCEADANSLASKIVGPLAEFSRGHRDEKSLRAALAAAVRPFEPVQGVEKPQIIYVDGNAGLYAERGQGGNSNNYVPRKPVQRETGYFPCSSGNSTALSPRMVLSQAR